MWASAWMGTRIRRMRNAEDNAEREDLGTIQGAALTLLALLIGFTFSMAVGRYDQRKNCEEVEANSIGTEYLRADLLQAADAARVRQLLKAYTEQRVLFYSTADADKLAQIDTSTSALRHELWFAVRSSATAQPSPITAMVASGMNDVLNSQGYTHAAWENRIPVAAWLLMVLIAIACNTMVGYNTHQLTGRFRLVFILPAIVAVSFFLIADMESPAHGVISVSPENLMRVANSMQPQ
jgi:hypothetical protein